MFCNIRKFNLIHSISVDDKRNEQKQVRELLSKSCHQNRLLWNMLIDFFLISI